MSVQNGKSLIELVLAKLPEGFRQTAAEEFAKPEAEEALKFLGDAAKRQDDYSRSMDELKKQREGLETDYANLNAWFMENKPRLDAYETLKAENERLKAEPLRRVVTEPAKVPDGMLTRDDLGKILEERDKGYADVLALSQDVGFSHYQMFGEKPNMREVVALAKGKGLSLEAAYSTIYGEKIAAKQKADEDARIDKIVAERLAAERKAQGDHPFPIRNASPSVLDILEQKGDPSKHTVDSAIAEYERLSAART